MFRLRIYGLSLFDDRIYLVSRLKTQQRFLNNVYSAISWNWVFVTYSLIDIHCIRRTGRVVKEVGSKSIRLTVLKPVPDIAVMWRIWKYGFNFRNYSTEICRRWFAGSGKSTVPYFDWIIWLLGSIPMNGTFIDRNKQWKNFQVWGSDLNFNNGM